MRGVFSGVSRLRDLFGKGLVSETRNFRFSLAAALASFQDARYISALSQRDPLLGGFA
ncbi:hypothetical protein UC8_46200 [Roseimaritima ulvae]|uniref:Uncharacterized protein n=1 Tax=Roseimaritima ulvae TaxID=980254 RepID=A0A5B9QXP9_9BACT|nr:hypothetical protein UC8_46200 [Roseimaritima ulvae]